MAESIEIPRFEALQKRRKIDLDEQFERIKEEISTVLDEETLAGDFVAIDFHETVSESVMDRVSDMPVSLGYPNDNIVFEKGHKTLTIRIHFDDPMARQ